MFYENTQKCSKSFLFRIYLLLFLIIAGCKEEEEVITPILATAKVMVIHASPDAPNLGLLIDNVLINPNVALEFSNYIEYLTLTSGT